MAENQSNRTMKWVCHGKMGTKERAAQEKSVGFLDKPRISGIVIVFSGQ